MGDVIYVGLDHGVVRFLGDAAGAGRWADRLMAATLVVWRVDPVRRRADRVLMHRAGDEWVLVADDGRAMHIPATDTTDPVVLDVMDTLCNAGPLPMVRVWEGSWVADGDSYRQFGLSHPLRDDDGGVYAEFCPEVIARQLAAARVSGDAARHYLTAMYLRILWHADHDQEIVDVDEREKIVDDLAYQTNPDVLRLVSMVQMAGLGEA